MTAGATTVTVAGRTLRLTNLAKVLWPEPGFTKGDLIDYYTAIAPVLLPHLAGRPLTLVRFPDGVDGPGFYQTSCPHPPPWLPTWAVPSPSGRRDGRNYCLVNDLPALVWVANLAAVELHPLLSRAPGIDTPTSVVFDLDPGPPAGLLDAAEVALLVREAVADAGLASFPKTSGWAGVHVYVPLNAPATYGQAKAFARGIARLLSARDPDRVIDRMPLPARAGRVLVDWSQNNPNKSTVAAYSLRAHDVPLASTPLDWEEVEGAVRAGDEHRLVFDAAGVLARIAARGDLFRPVLEMQQTLP